MGKSPRTETTPTPAELRDRLRTAGLRATAPRVAVLRQLLEARAPLTHAELAERLAPAGWDRATIWRNLTDLTEQNMLRRTDLGDHVWRFEIIEEGKSAHDAKAAHAHFVCNECGDVVCLPDGSVEVKAAKGLPRALRGEVEIQLKGRCDECVS